MKKILLFSFILSSILYFSQITMSPQATHYNDPYAVTISGNGTIYYTVDGSTPTLSSSSATNNVQILIDSNKEIKAFVLSSGTTSPVISKKYYTGAIPVATMFFKMPSGWTNSSCAMINMVNPNAINGSAIDSLWPGFVMTATGCENWYKVTRNFETGTVSFNNCSPFPNIPQTITTNEIPVNGLIYYDFTSGPISNPPSCLFLGTEETTKSSVTLVKIYPNPVSDILHINSEIDFKEYEILDISGKIVHQSKIFVKDIPISHLPFGNYFIKLRDLKNNFVLLKFVKK